MDIEDIFGAQRALDHLGWELAQKLADRHVIYPHEEIVAATPIYLDFLISRGVEPGFDGMLAAFMVTVQQVESIFLSAKLRAKYAVFLDRDEGTPVLKYLPKEYGEGLQLLQDIEWALQ